MLPIREAWMLNKPISYYCNALDDGDSKPVDIQFSDAMLDSLVHALVVSLDSTGHAHLDASDHEG